MAAGAFWAARSTFARARKRRAEAKAVRIALEKEESHTRAIDEIRAQQHAQRGEHLSPLELAAASAAALTEKRPVTAGRLAAAAYKAGTGSGTAG
jgi:hypothetical protein